MSSPSRSSSLFIRLRRALLALALAPLLLGFGISLFSYGVSEHGKLLDEYQRRVTRIGDSIALFLGAARERLEQTQRFWNYGALPAAEQRRILRDILASHEEFSAIDYLDAGGERRLRVSRRDFGEKPAPHWREQEAVARVIASESLSFGKVEIDPATGEPTLLLVLPVREPASGRMSGMLVAELSLKGVWRELARLGGGQADEVLVVSAERRVIANVNPSVVLAGTRYAPPSATGAHRDLRGRRALVAVQAVELPGNTLTVVLTRTLVSAYGVWLFQLGVALAILLLTLALALALLRRMARWLIDPVITLTEAAERIRADEKGVRVEGAFTGEMATLAQAFNLMLDRLRAEQAALEQRVHERTRELRAVGDAASEARRMLLAVLDTIPQRIFWKNRDLVYLGCNDLFARDAGKASPAEVIGKTDHDMVWAGIAELYRSDDKQVMHSGQPKLAYEEPQTTEDGRTLWLRTSKVPLRDASGQIIGVLGTYEDISDEKNAALELRAAKEEAERASRAKSLFLSSMSHELRTPLNAILGYAQLLEMEEGLPPDVQQSAREILQAGRHLLALVSDVLDLARVEAGRVEFLLEDLDLDAVLRECLSHNQPRAAEHGVTLTTAPACRSQRVRGDARRLLQVLDNLVSNAIKYNKKGGEVVIDCGVADGRCRVSVKDTGPGMTLEQQKHLFQLFSRAGAEMSGIEGTGIGLTIAKQLVEGMGGAIGVDSLAGFGSTFWIELPTAGGAALSSPPPPPLAEPAPPPAPAGVDERPRVLVAEDYPPNQNILRLQLQSLGCQVDIAPDGAAALMKWRRERPDLVLSDLNMPVMDGLALARAVRQNERELGGRTPIIAITAAAVQEELQRCLDAGMDDALTKPITVDGLRAALQRWLPARAAARPAAPAETPAGAAEAQAVFDPRVLVDVLGQVDSTAARELIDTFLQAARQGLEQLARRPDDSVTLGKEMHKQKSSARTVGALRYGRLAEQLETGAREGAAAGAEGIASLRAALREVELAVARWLDRDAGAVQEPAEALPVVQCKSVLVVDDDPVILKQVPALLASLGVDEVLTASNGLEAIVLLSERAAALEVVMCDLNMPEMDGVELIRRFGQTGFKGGLILMSGADQQIINTASQLAELQGLRVLGQVHKPVAPRELAGLLRRMNEQAAAGKPRPVRSAAQISAEAVREAMDRGEFTVWFQPKVDAAVLQPVGLESLARWRRPDGSFVPPDQFITLAEREGLIGELSGILTTCALREMRHVREAGFPLKLAINLSGQWLDDLRLPDTLVGLAREAGIEPHNLVLEVTETGVMEDLTTALDVLTRLRLKGFGLSIDDFGIGYSSFEQLGRIPFTEMKLDRSFVNKGSHDAAARAILESSMAMAAKLKLHTVAEGVETPEELALVRELGCDSVQGYLIAKPMPVDELIVWLNRTVSQ